MRATVSALLSGPSSEVKTVSLTGPISFSNSRLTACSSCAVRNPMASVYPETRRGAFPPSLSVTRRFTPHDLEHFSITGWIDPRVDESGAGRRLRGREGGGEAGLVRDCPRGHAEGAGQGGRVGSRVAHRD